MIDSHCHLADAQFAPDLEEVLRRMRDAGVERAVVIADTLADGEKCLALAARYEQLFCTIGVHPHAAKEWKPGDGERLRALLRSSPKAKAVGEIGLDYHYDRSPRDVQRAVFAEQLAIAKELGLPAVVHCREAVADVRDLVLASAARIVLHCCTERWEDVEPLVAAGHLLSFTGIATYPKSEEVRRTIERCPLSSLLIETDAPYLAPVPHRGKRNEPAFVAEVLACVARTKGMDEKEVDAATTCNAVEFFGLPAATGA